MGRSEAEPFRGAYSRGFFFITITLGGLKIGRVLDYVTYLFSFV
ncbi:hypothetical protein KKC1_34820 [Calderihabitans maritimus]|uniref:Uncharacterized protein n=1 Tax=Calderihabitans maritimus TaxID=1246530 RepID=A0A1Z5HXX3_9FIRM|nr:hypothetical protein KKC1_34820 [Calderihabitans maritimus]